MKILPALSPAVPPPEHEGELMSKYLIQYVSAKPQKVSAAGKRAPDARVLISEECVQILKGREEKKKGNWKRRLRERLKENRRKRKRGSC